MGVPNYGNKEQCPTSIRKPGDWFGRGADPKHCGARATEFSIRKGIRSYNCLRLVFTQCFAARPEVSKNSKNPSSPQQLLSQTQDVKI
ncbi:uncharacterized protein LOC113460896 isoform X7 [Zonotrichia albicollis]|uniref:uncharacterized protein LOC113460896 isoform X7 n=1 Tax=Zonotrichia albicollis TaxID=44394 RepID=UPI003D80F870